MRHAEPEEGALDVTLTEADGDGAPGAAGPGGSRGGRPTARGRRWHWYAAAIVAVVGIAVGASVLESRREEARRSELALIPGVVARMDHPWEEAWRARVGQLVAADGDVVVLVDEESGSVRGLDLRTGDEVWSQQLAPGETCFVVRAPTRTVRAEPDVVRSTEPVTPSPEVVACGGAPAPAGGGDAVLSRLLLLATATGATAAQVDVVGQVAAVGRDGADVFVASVTGEDVLVGRWSLGTGDHAWTAEAPDGFLDAVGLPESVLRVEDGLLWWGGPGVTPLDLATGEPVPGATSAASGIPLPDGGAVVRIPGEVPLGPTTRVLDADGSVRVEVEGEPWLPPVTDGSVGDVLTMRRPETGAAVPTRGVVGVDARTGEIRWDGQLLLGVFPRVQVDGVLVGVGAGRTVALDVRTGEVLWERRSRTPPNISTMTDGDVVLVPDHDADAGLVLVAYGIRDGDERWRTPIPGDAVSAGVVGDAVVVRTDDGTTVVLAPPG